MFFNPFRRRRRHHRCHGGRHDSRCSLRQCEAGDHVVVDHIDPGVTCAPRLRELGIMEGMPLVVLRQSDPLVLLTEVKCGAAVTFPCLITLLGSHTYLNKYTFKSSPRDNN